MRFYMNEAYLVDVFRLRPHRIDKCPCDWYSVRCSIRTFYTTGYAPEAARAANFRFGSIIILFVHRKARISLVRVRY